MAVKRKGPKLSDSENYPFNIASQPLSNMLSLVHGSLKWTLNPGQCVKVAPFQFPKERNDGKATHFFS